MDRSFPVSRLDYALPEDLIAQSPADPRDSARLLAVDRASGTWCDRTVRDLPDLLRPGDLLVVNNTKVLPAKFTLLRQTGGRIQGLFVKELHAGAWQVLLRGAARLRHQETLTFNGDPAKPTLTPVQDLGDGLWTARIWPALPAAHMLERVGVSPLPPYIHRPKGLTPGQDVDRSTYQSVFACQAGAVAAPTAGLHFTPQLLDALDSGGIDHVPVTLHVGLGTFAPVAVDDLRDHQMHAEWYEIPAPTAERIGECRKAGGRIVAVGTTVVRVLESVMSKCGDIQPGSDWTRLLIFPPYRFTCVDALLTNFHLPRSTLLALVMAFAGEELVHLLYEHAIQGRYRFFSYGDAMLIQ